MGFTFRTRAEYKRVKAMDRHQMEEYIDAQKKLSVQARGIANNIVEQQLIQQGWDKCAEAYKEIMHQQIDQILDSIDSGIIQAIENTKGIGVKRGQELLDNLSDAKRKIKEGADQMLTDNQPHWCEDERIGEMADERTN